MNFRNIATHHHCTQLSLSVGLTPRICACGTVHQLLQLVEAGHLTACEDAFLLVDNANSAATSRSGEANEARLFLHENPIPQPEQHHDRSTDNVHPQPCAKRQRTEPVGERVETSRGGCAYLWVWLWVGHDAYPEPVWIYAHAQNIIGWRNVSSSRVGADKVSNMVRETCYDPCFFRQLMFWRMLSHYATSFVYFMCTCIWTSHRSMTTSNDRPEHQWTKADMCVLPLSEKNVYRAAVHYHGRWMVEIAQGHRFMNNVACLSALSVIDFMWWHSGWVQHMWQQYVSS